MINSPTVGVNDATWGVIVTNAFRNMTNAISAIYNVGGREILVGNLAFLGKIPAFLGSPAGYTNYIDSKIATYNLLLASGLTNVVKYCPGLRGIYRFWTSTRPLHQHSQLGTINIRVYGHQQRRVGRSQPDR